MNAFTEMLRSWQNFYFMMGGAAATLVIILLLLSAISNTWSLVMWIVEVKRN
jgi:hypothetical protein